MGRRILETSDSIIQNKINRFFEKNLSKSVNFEKTSVRGVWHVRNANTPANYNVWAEIGKLIRSNEIVDKVERDKIFAEHEKINPSVFLGRGYVTAGCTIEEAMLGLRMLNRHSDSNMFEIDEFEGIYICWD